MWKQSRMLWVSVVIAAVMAGCGGSSSSEYSDGIGDGDSSIEDINDSNDSNGEMNASAYFETRKAAALGGLRVYFGNLHSHSDASDGEGEPSEILSWARYDAGYDFYAMTDHAEMVSSSEWDKIGAWTDGLNEDGKFVAMRGFEWSHSLAGHICVYGTGTYTNAILTPTLGLFYLWLDNNDGLAQFNHPGREVEVFRDFSYDESVADNIFAVETGNKGSGNNDGEYYAYFDDALAAGWHLAPTNNQDNHSMTTNTHRTAIIAPSLTRAGLLQAMRDRRLYSTDDPNMEVIFKSGEIWMGDTVVVEDNRIDFTVIVDDDEPITKIQLIGDGDTLIGEYVVSGDDDPYHLIWEPSFNNVAGLSYMFVRVFESNRLDDDLEEQIAVSAPIRFRQAE